MKSLFYLPFSHTHQGITQLRKYIHSQHVVAKPQAPLASVASTSLLSTPSQTNLCASTAGTLRSVNRHYLVGLLAQALSSTYLGLLVYALHTRDACVLYRLASARLDSATWGKVFGGTYRAKPTRPSAPPAPAGSTAPGLPRPPRPERPTPILRAPPGTNQKEKNTEPAPASLDDSEPPDNSYDSYSEALAKQQRRIRRLARRMERSHAAGAKREAQRRAKEALRRRLARHTGVLNQSDDEDEKTGGTVPSVEELYPELVEKGRLQAELSAVKSTAIAIRLPRRWILRRLHLDSDFGESQFHATSVDLNDWMSLSGPGCASDDDLSGSDDPDCQGDFKQSVGALNGRGGQWEVQRQWAKGDSYAWRLMRLGIIHLAKRELERLVQLLDFGSDDLAVYAPALVTATRLVDTWMVGYRLELTSPPALTSRDLARGSLNLIPTWHLLPPANFLPDSNDSELAAINTGSGTELGSDPAGALRSASQLPSAGATRAMIRLRQLIDPSKTPFQTRDPFSLPTKRLWCYLVRQPNLDDLFIRHVFREPRPIQSLIIPNQSGLDGGLHPSSDIGDVRQATEPYGSMVPKSVHGTSATNLPTLGTAVDETHKMSTGRAIRFQATDKQSAIAPGKSQSLLYDDAIRLVHKEQDPLIAMCVNQVNHSCIAIATPKEVIELNVDNLVTLPAWYADEVEYDLELMRRPQSRVYPEGGTDDFIVIDSNLDVASGTHGAPSSSVSQSLAGANVGSGSSGAHVMLKRTLQAVYCLASHPTLPYYLCGTGTGSLHLFEWATAIPVVAGFTNTYALTAAGASGQYPAGSRGARVTALYFDRSGRRFGCGDADGNFGLWNMQAASAEKPPYFRCHCHAKSLADFCFVGSSTLIATAGNGGGSSGDTGSSSHLIAGVNVSSGPATTVASGSTGLYRFGADSTSSVGMSATSSFGLEQNAANLALWDTLLPPNRCGVIRWSPTEPSFARMPWMSTGSPVVVAPRDRMVVVGTKRGDVCFVDLRKPSVLHSFNAHESSAVRTLCVDQASDCLITGGADGIVKIWRLSEPELIASFSGNIHHQGRGAAAAVAAAALFRGNQSAAIIAATHPGVSQIRLLPVVTGASLLHQGKPAVPLGSELAPDGLSCAQHESEKHSLLSACNACRFLSCGADGGLRMRSFVVRPKPFTVA
ncbi:unnamed protein product [Echinostoma caproni]|uniref:WD_REPEATS_REGION domain-containing protein n=1 Tax=Echinostoma caproni TaxID=27848 RepID=A0A183AF37_9TREM|nr:unnamed protein product [Echinostoma caproni]